MSKSFLFTFSQVQGEEIVRGFMLPLLVTWICTGTVFKADNGL